MNRNLVFLFLLISIGHITAYHQDNAVDIIPKNKDPFNVKFQVDKLNPDRYDLAITIELNQGDYIISPYSQDNIYDHFGISIEQASNLVTEENLIEIPNSIEEIDPVLKTPVRFVRENTTYKQRLRILEDDDFEVRGIVEFVLEPSCVPYDIEFVLSYRSKKIEVKKVNTSISKEYKK